MLRLSVFGQLKERKGHRKVNIFTEDTYSKQGRARHRFIGSPLMYKSITLDFTQYSNFWGEIGFSKAGNITIPGKVTTVCLCVCFV